MAKVGSKDVAGKVLRFGARWGILPLVRWCLSKGARVDDFDSFLRQTPLMLAAKGCNKEIVRLVLLAGADPNTEDALGVTPLAWAFIGMGRKPTRSPRRDRGLAIMKLLLKRGAAVNDPASPIAAAIRMDDAEVIDILLEAGAEWNVPLREGRTPLEILREQGSSALRARYLLDPRTG